MHLAIWIGLGMLCSGAAVVAPHAYDSYETWHASHERCSYELASGVSLHHGADVAASGNRVCEASEPEDRP